jgi:hypothetical protein
MQRCSCPLHPTKATRSHVRGQHDVVPPALELVEHPVALALALVAVQRQRGEACAAHLRREAVAAPLGLAEDECLLFLVLAHHLLQLVVLVVVGHHLGQGAGADQVADGQAGLAALAGMPCGTMAVAWLLLLRKQGAAES